jgi:serine/threonine-protein kinase
MEEQTATGTVLGSPRYMSPEQTRAAAAVTPLADVWACGVILFEGLTGTWPHEGDSYSSLVVAICTVPPRSIDQLAPAVPEPLRAIVRDCLKPLDQRLRGAALLADRLAAALADPSLAERPLPRPASPPPEPGKTITGVRIRPLLTTTGSSLPNLAFGPLPPPTLPLPPTLALPAPSPTLDGTLETLATTTLRETTPATQAPAPVAPAAVAGKAAPDGRGLRALLAVLAALFACIVIALVAVIRSGSSPGDAAAAAAASAAPPASAPPAPSTPATVEPAPSSSASAPAALADAKPVDGRHAKAPPTPAPPRPPPATPPAPPSRSRVKDLGSGL